MTTNFRKSETLKIINYWKNVLDWIRHTEIVPIFQLNCYFAVQLASYLAGQTIRYLVVRQWVEREKDIWMRQLKFEYSVYQLRLQNWMVPIFVRRFHKVIAKRDYYILPVRLSVWNRRTVRGLIFVIFLGGGRVVFFLLYYFNTTRWWP
jgi:hypothetical protein